MNQVEKMNKEKKKYISPLVEELVVVSSNMLAGSNPQGSGVLGGGSGSAAGDGSAQLSAGNRRGSWGNLWE